MKTVTMRVGNLDRVVSDQEVVNLGESCRRSMTSLNDLALLNAVLDRFMDELMRPGCMGYPHGDEG